MQLWLAGASGKTAKKEEEFFLPFLSLVIRFLPTFVCFPFFLKRIEFTLSCLQAVKHSALRNEKEIAILNPITFGEFNTTGWAGKKVIG